MRSPAETGRTRPLVMTALLAAVACVLGYAESVLVPSLPIPGVRLGLANIAVVVGFALLGRRSAFAIALTRVMLVGLATGTLFGPIGAMSLAGALSAWGLMALVSLSSRFSPAGWSIAGAWAHGAGQLGAAAAITGSIAPFLMAPATLGVSLATGCAIGALATLLLSRSPELNVGGSGMRGWALGWRHDLSAVRPRRVN